jgi:hypothetical protein
MVIRILSKCLDPTAVASIKTNNLSPRWISHLTRINLWETFRCVKVRDQIRIFLRMSLVILVGLRMFNSLTKIQWITASWTCRLKTRSEPQSPLTTSWALHMCQMQVDSIIWDCNNSSNPLIQEDQKHILGWTLSGNAKKIRWITINSLQRGCKIEVVKCNNKIKVLGKMSPIINQGHLSKIGATSRLKKFTCRLRVKWIIWFMITKLHLAWRASMYKKI